MRTSLRASLYLCLFLSASAWSALTTFPLDLHLYKAHTPFEHLQYSVTNDASALDDAIRKHFSARGWVLSQSSQNSGYKTSLSLEAHLLVGDVARERLAAFRERDFRKDKRIIKKWKRTRRWKDWAGEPHYRNVPAVGHSTSCLYFRSPVINASISGAANTFKEQIAICMQSSEGNQTSVIVTPQTLHFIDGFYQAATGQIGVLWINWLDGTGLASEVAALKLGITSTAPVEGRSPDAEESSPTLRSGTGFFVSNKAVVTNQHVIDGCSQVKINSDNSATVVAQDVANDLAILFSKSSSQDFLRLSAANVSLGDDISVYGYPLQSVLSPTIHLTKGSVSSLAGLQGNSAFFQMTAPIQPGNSGGPVIDKNGLVVGVTTSTLSPTFAINRLGTIPQGVNFAVRTTMLTNLLEVYGIAVGERSDTQRESEITENAVVLLTCE